MPRVIKEKGAITIDEFIAMKKAFESDAAVPTEGRMIDTSHLTDLQLETYREMIRSTYAESS